MAGQWVRRGLIGVLLTIWSIQVVNACVNPRGDFLLHYEFGRRLQGGEFLYQGGMHAPYPPAWAVPHAPLSLVPPGVAKPIVHLIGIVSLVALLAILHDLTRGSLPLRRNQHFWVCAATLVASVWFLLRDYDDGGQNVILMTSVWLGIWLSMKERPILGGSAIGLAVALKCTAGIFVLYFLLKRQWRFAASSLACAGLFSLSPLLWMTPQEFHHTAQSWAETVTRGISQQDPTVGVIGPEKLQNWSLRNSLARYLVHLPPGHPGRAYTDNLPDGHPDRVPHFASVDFLDLEPGTAGFIIKGLMGLGLLLAVWFMRNSHVGDEGDRLRYLWELAAVGVIGLLYSPITWGQHCVAVLPALYLLVRGSAAGKLPDWISRFLIAYALVFILVSRVTLGKSLGLLVESYHLYTFAIVGLLGAMFVTRPGTSAVIVAKPVVTPVQPMQRAA